MSIADDALAPDRVFGPVQLGLRKRWWASSGLRVAYSWAAGTMTTTCSGKFARPPLSIIRTDPFTHVQTENSGGGAFRRSVAIIVSRCDDHDAAGARRGAWGRAELGQPRRPEDDQALRPTKAENHPEHCGEDSGLCGCGKGSRINQPFIVNGKEIVIEK